LTDLLFGLNEGKDEEYNEALGLFPITPKNDTQIKKSHLFGQKTLDKLHIIDT